MFNKSQPGHVRPGLRYRGRVVAALAALIAVAATGAFTEKADAAVRLSDGTNVSLDVYCTHDWSGKWVKYATGASTAGVWYRVFTRMYDANWRFLSSGTTAWVQMSAGNEILAGAFLAPAVSAIRNYVFEVQFFKNGVYTKWYATSPITHYVFNPNGGFTSAQGCRL